MVAGHCKKRIARKGNQSDPVTPQFLDQVAHPPFGLLQAVGLDILRQHALRGVERNDDAQSALLYLFPLEAPLRTGQRDDAQRQ